MMRFTMFDRGPIEAVASRCDCLPVPLLRPAVYGRGPIEAR